MTKEELEQIRKIIQEENGALETRLNKRIDDLDMKIEVSFAATNTKLDQRSEQIMDVIADTATEILKEQDQRISHIEEHLGLENPAKKN